MPKKPTQPPNPDRMTRFDLAAEYGVHPSTVHRWTRAGMPCVRLGPAGTIIRYRLSECAAWIERANQTVSVD